MKIVENSGFGYPISAANAKPPFVSSILKEAGKISSMSWYYRTIPMLCMKALFFCYLPRNCSGKLVLKKGTFIFEILVFGV